MSTMEYLTSLNQAPIEYSPFIPLIGHRGYLARARRFTINRCRKVS